MQLMETTLADSRMKATDRKTRAGMKVVVTVPVLERSGEYLPNL